MLTADETAWRRSWYAICNPEEEEDDYGGGRAMSFELRAGAGDSNPSDVQLGVSYFLNLIKSSHLVFTTMMSKYLR